MLVYTIFNVQMIPNNVDQAMFNNGILRSLVNGNIGTELMMEDLIAKLDKKSLPVNSYNDDACICCI